MNKVKIFKIENLNEIQLEQIENNSNTLFITSTRSLNYQTKKEKDFNIIDFTQLQANIKTITKQKNCLTDSEMRYFLNKTILQLSDKNIYKLAFLNSQNLIYELFNNLLISDISSNNINFKKIKNKALKSNVELFNLYLSFLDNIKKQNKSTFQSSLRESLKDYLKQFDNVCLIGFTFFNDLQNAIFNILVENNINVRFVINDDFIINDFVLPLLKKKNINFEILNLNDKKVLKFDELRTNLFNNNSIDTKIKDSIKFYKPFFTRETEFQFIVNQIQKELKECSTLDEIKNVCENIAVVITNQFSKQTQIFNELFKQTGVFISPDNKVFYSQEEFLQSDYENKLSKEERLQIFSSFVRLEMYQLPKTLFNSSIGRFISELYKISGTGMRLANFNTLLQINWLFKNTKINDILSEFNVIKDFFENIENIQEWKKKIVSLIELKNNLNFDNELHNHPLKAIRSESLEFIKKYIFFLENTITKIQNENGNIKKHIKTLIEAIKEEVNDEKIEQQLLQEFEEILNTKNEGIDIDNEYFAKNFQQLIGEYLTNKKTKNNNLRINAINLESANTYKTVFVPMFEENKYPMSFKHEFPYTKEIVDLLSNEKFITNYNLPLNKTLEYNIKLSKYVFENLFRIAKENIIFTRVDSENGNPIDLSIFGYDIKEKLKDLKELDYSNSDNKILANDETNVIYKDIEIDNMFLNELLTYFVCPKMFYYSNKFNDKNCFTDKFLLNFYCKALIVNKILSSLASNEIYNKKSLMKKVDELINSSAKEIFNILPMFEKSNENDIVLSAKQQVLSFLNDKILTGKFKPAKDFTISLSEQKIIKHNNIEVKTYKNLVVNDLDKQTSYEFDISKSLDLLISSTGGKQTNEEHFKDIIEEMEKRYSNLDYANSLNFLSFKINTQLNTPKFYNDGITRVKNLVDMINNRKCSNFSYNKTSYCSFCKYKNICIGGLDNE